MKGSIRSFVATAAIGLGLITAVSVASAQTNDFKKLSAEWWQWALSIPRSVNPLTDTTGEDCMVGQRGPRWFLAGFAGAGSATRNCSVPEGIPLFFPVANFVNINTPNVCQQSGDLTVATLRQQAADFIDGVTDVSVELDGTAVKGVRRIQSEVFEVALPEDNLFDAFCADNVPAGIYSPAIDDGFYVELKPLTIGNHTLHILASGTNVSQDITYDLTVVPVTLK